MCTEASIQTDTLVINADSAIINEYILLQRRYQQMFESQKANSRNNKSTESVSTQVGYCDMLIEANCEESQRIKVSATPLSDNNPCLLANSYKSLRESLVASGSQPASANVQVAQPRSTEGIQGNSILIPFYKGGLQTAVLPEISFSNIGANPTPIWEESRPRVSSYDIGPNVFESLLISEYMDDSDLK